LESKCGIFRWFCVPLTVWRQGRITSSRISTIGVGTTIRIRGCRLLLRRNGTLFFVALVRRSWVKEQWDDSEKNHWKMSDPYHVESAIVWAKCSQHSQLNTVGDQWDPPLWWTWLQTYSSPQPGVPSVNCSVYVARHQAILWHTTMRHLTYHCF
jgi:hypothetical protein